MPGRNDITYFGAGPALLPTDVLERAAAALVDYNNGGLGLAEISHRSEPAAAIVRDARADLATFLDVPTDEYEVVLMQAGGTGEFSATVYNLVGAWVLRERAKLVAQGLPDDDASPELLTALRAKVDSELRLDYLVTGSWSLKAYQEAQRLLGADKVNLVADGRKEVDSRAGKASKFAGIPDEATWTKNLSPNAALVYYCDNETVDGVEFPQFPPALAPAAGNTTAPIVADMSSNILSRPVPVRNYGVFFFGAQKNLGSTGITVAVVKRSLLPQPSADLLRALHLPIGPIVLQYETIAKNDSLYNTLSIFDVYIAGQVLKKLLAAYPNDKAAGQEAVSVRKANQIYAALDAHQDVYRIAPIPAVRSRMNIVFRVVAGEDGGEAAEKAFLKEGTALGLTGLKGHRSVGGIRASNYNTISEEGAAKLAKFIDDFAKKIKA
ncbi:Phosphoserine transaminase [Sporothrix eucalyptigena]|uniref:phosphoserine transaminase n=1 Tax=Sporothrix eucalyptigena TaxID=1812306 RepID=A0ABP0BHV5_9PEZI